MGFNWSAVIDFVIKVGVEPAIIAGQGYIIYKLITDGHEAQTAAAVALQSNTDAMSRFIDFAKGVMAHA